MKKNQTIININEICDIYKRYCKERGKDFSVLNLVKHRAQKINLRIRSKTFWAFSFDFQNVNVLGKSFHWSRIFGKIMLNKIASYNYFIL